MFKFANHNQGYIYIMFSPNRTMPKISQSKIDKIQEQILHYLFTTAPQPKFTSEIANSIARDEEFTKVLLEDLKIKTLVVEIKKNPKGEDYIKRQRWRLADVVYNLYQQRQ